MSNFFGENFGNFDHWDSAFPNFRQGPIYNQTCSRLPIDPTSSILGPCPVPLLVLLSHACFTFHREIEGQTIEIIKTLQTPVEYIRLALTHSMSLTSCFRARPRHWLSPHTCLNVYMFICLYVYMFICSYVSEKGFGCKYWILDIGWQTLYCLRQTWNLSKILHIQIFRLKVLHRNSA